MSFEQHERCTFPAHLGCTPLAARARTTTVRLHGEVSAASARGLLRVSIAGRRALAALAAGRATASVRSGSPSRVTLR